MIPHYRWWAVARCACLVGGTVRARELGARWGRAVLGPGLGRETSPPTQGAIAADYLAQHPTRTKLRMASSLSYDNLSIQMSSPAARPSNSPKALVIGSNR